jgi:hypothetical protein
MAFTQILQLQEVVMEKGQQCKLGERESVTLLLWEISQFLSFMQFARNCWILQ